MSENQPDQLISLDTMEVKRLSSLSAELDLLP